MKKTKRILVGLKDYKHGVELAELACCMAARGASLLLVHVIELPDNTPLDAEVPELESTARKILRAAERVAKRSRTKTTPRVLRAHSAGAALLDELETWRIDLAVVGYHHKRTLGEILLGTTAKHLTGSRTVPRPGHRSPEEVSGRHGSLGHPGSGLRVTLGEH
jgi:nucleotide-binding universal stress UspA family protein